MQWQHETILEHVTYKLLGLLENVFAHESMGNRESRILFPLTRTRIGQILVKIKSGKDQTEQYNVNDSCTNIS